MSKELESNALLYWDSRYLENTTGWDLGEVSPPLKEYIKQLSDKNLRILIPGCGNTYEADYLLKQGFTNITVIDIAPTLVEALKKKYSDYPALTVLLGDFFNHAGTYDLILEQTFFCALFPDLRSNYVQKMNSLLALNGKLVGLLFNKQFEKEGPPYGGSLAEYQNLFSKAFILQKMEACYNSLPKREGSELFIILKKKI